jgi:hypothetical protein
VHVVAQATPQSPQLAGSLCAFTQAPAQPSCPVGQHVPLEMARPAGHTQAPLLQLGVGSAQATRFAQVVPQLVSLNRFVSQPSLIPLQSAKPALHLMLHAPAVHAAVPFTAEQALVAQLVPQLATVLIVVSQAVSALPSQSILPAGQATQAPAEHSWFCGQATASAQTPFAPQVVTPPAPTTEQVLAPGEHWPEQAPLTHAEFAQSAFVAQPWPTVQSAAQLPPQSMSVSLPFLMASLQLAATHLPFVHFPLLGSTQSALVLHSLFTAQPPQLPPQSTSVSLPFWTPSLQAAAAHFLATHLPLAGSAQSASLAQPLWGGQPPQLPPQSTSVSLPFFTASPQVAATHAPCAHR